jgi:hypothetical protein
MAIPSDNTIRTNSLAELVTARAAESAYYFTVGSKKYFKDQLAGKRNGNTYRFVIRDVGGAYKGLAANIATEKTSITEREVTLSIENYRVLIESNAIESITSLDWDPEIAEPNGQKLAQLAVKDVMASDFGKVGTCFVGRGFAPLSRASAHLSSITTEDLYGFCDPNVEAILTSNGQQFVPVSAPDMYSKGLLGKFHGAEYRSQRFFPSVAISTGSEFEGGKVSVTSYTLGSSGYDTLVLGADTLTSSLKKGTPIFIEGVYACDTVGDPTSMLHAFIVLEDATASSNSITVKVPHIDVIGEGTRDVADASGNNFTVDQYDKVTSFASVKVSIPEDGIYYMGIVRAPAAFEFETLDKLEAAGADYEKVSAEGLNVHKNQLVDLEKMINYTRFDLPVLAGTVEPRLVSMFLVK